MKTARLRSGQYELEIAYRDEGAGEPVLLVHGFASSKEVNWASTGWIKALTDAGFRTIAFDNRGHGGSTKFYGRSDYAIAAMAADAHALLHHLGAAPAHVVGYSMGARIAAQLALDFATDVRRLVLSGNGSSLYADNSGWGAIEAALLAPSLADVTDPRGRMFRQFAEQTGSDLKALAACAMGARQLFTREQLASISHETLVAIGTEDDLAGSGEELAALMPNARHFPIEGRDHMKAVGDRSHIQGVIDFLRGGGAAP